MSNQTLQSILGSKTVSFYAIFAKAIGSVPAAVMLSQAFFWQEECRYKKHLIDLKGKLFFQKTAEEWYEETGLTKEQQLTARKNLRERGILQEELAGMPATTHYRVDIDGLVAVINRYLLERDTVAVKHRNKMRQMPRASSGKFRQQDAVKDGNSYNIESLESKKESEKEREPQAAFITTHTPTEFENIRIVEGQTFDLEENTNLEPISPAAGKKPRTPKPAGNNITAVCAEISDDRVLVFFHGISEAWQKWTAYKRRERKGPYKSPQSEATAIARLAKTVGYNVEAGRDALDYSEAQGFTGVYLDNKFVTSAPAARYSLEDRPQANTPEQMKEELSMFYNANSALLSEAQKTAGTNYTGDRLRSIVIDFCINRIAKARQGETFGQHHAALGSWMKRQKEFDAGINPIPHQHPTGPQPQAPLRSAAPVNYSIK